MVKRHKSEDNLVLQLAGKWLDGGSLELLQDEEPVGQELELSAGLWAALGVLMNKAIKYGNIHRQGTYMDGNELATKLREYGIGDGMAAGVHPLIHRLRRQLNAWAQPALPDRFGEKFIITRRGGGYRINYPPDRLRVLELPPGASAAVSATVSNRDPRSRGLLLST